MSRLRTVLNASLEKIAMSMNLENKSILEIGIAGDDKPSGSYQFFGKGNKWTTVDKNPKWGPDFVDDITQSNFKDNEFDLVIMTQTLEHIWDYNKALSELYRITSDYLIIDCPFLYEFHQDYLRPCSWEEWDDYWRFTPAAFRKLLLGAGFKTVNVTFSNENTLAVCRKHL